MQFWEHGVLSEPCGQVPQHYHLQMSYAHVHKGRGGRWILERQQQTRHDVSGSFSGEMRLGRGRHSW